MSDTEARPRRRRVKKRWLAGIGGACLTALTVIEAASPLCPALEAYDARAGQLCRAVTLTARAATAPAPGPNDRAWDVTEQRWKAAP